MISRRTVLRGLASVPVVGMGQVPMQAFGEDLHNAAADATWPLEVHAKTIKCDNPEEIGNRILDLKDVSTPVIFQLPKGTFELSAPWPSHPWGNRIAIRGVAPKSSPKWSGNIDLDRARAFDAWSTVIQPRWRLSDFDHSMGMISNILVYGGVDGVVIKSGNIDIKNCCFFEQNNVSMLNDFGGSIRSKGCHILFGVDGCRTDFRGIQKHEGIQIYSCSRYGARGNHGGELYFVASDPVRVVDCSTGLDATDVSLIHAHNARIIDCQTSVTSTGGRLDLYKAKLVNSTEAAIIVLNGGYVRVTQGSISTRDSDGISVVSGRVVAHGAEIAGSGVLVRVHPEFGRIEGLE